MSTRRALYTALATLIVGVGGLVLATAPSFAARAYTAAPEFHIGEPGSGDGQLLHPDGVAVNEETGDVYVADAGNNRIEEFSPTGAYITQFNGSETPARSFSGVSDVAVNNSTGPGRGDVYVVTGAVTGAVVDVFGPHGEYLSQLTGTPSEAFTSILGIAVDGSGDLWAYATAAGNPNDTVYEFSETGALVQQFEGEVASEPAFAVDASQNAFVTQCCGAEVEEYSVSGVPLGGLKKTYDTFEIAGSPANDNVFVLTDDDSDPADHIEEFSPSGSSKVSELSATFGTPPEAPKTGVLRGGTVGELPEGIAVNGSDGTVYVAQSEAGLVDVFEDLFLPAVSGGPASSLTRTTATVSGTVSPEGQPVTGCVFEYASSALYEANKAYEVSVPCSQALSSLTGSSTLEVSAPLSGLVYGDTYHYRLVASNAGGASDGADGTFTLVVAPTVSLLPASLSHVTQTAALIGGMVDPEGLATSCYLEYGPSSAYGDQSEPTSIGSANAEVQCGPVALSGLTAGSTYHYRFVASNQAGTTYGPDEAFTTAPATRPIVVTGAASGVSATAATLTGVLQPRGLQTSYEFEVGTSTAYGGAKLFGNAGASGGSEAVSVSLGYLVPGTTYHYRLVASNEDGTGYGQDVTFTTPGVPNPIAQPLAAPLIATPAIVFPTGSLANTGTTETKTLTKAQKLAKALQACKQKDKNKGAKRVACEKQARSKYGAAKKGKKGGKRK